MRLSSPSISYLLLKLFKLSSSRHKEKLFEGCYSSRSFAYFSPRIVLPALYFQPINSVRAWSSSDYLCLSLCSHAFINSMKSHMVLAIQMPASEQAADKQIKREEKEYNAGQWPKQTSSKTTHPRPTTQHLVLLLSFLWCLRFFFTRVKHLPYLPSYAHTLESLLKI